jgi:hypothetical protein
MNEEVMMNESGPPQMKQTASERGEPIIKQKKGF